MDKNISDLLKDIEKPALPMFIINWIFAIGIIEYPMGRQRRVISFLQISITLVVYCILAYYAYPFMVSMTREFETNITIMKLLFACNIFLTISTTVLGWYRSQGMHAITQYIAVADYLLENIGITRNYKKVFRSQMRNVLGLVTFVLVILTVNSLILFSINHERSGKITAIFAMNYPIIIMFIVDTTFVNIIQYIRLKLSQLNGVLKSMTTTTYYDPQHARIVKYFYKAFETSQKCGVNSIIVDQAYIICTAKEIHLKLVETCKILDSIFGLHILLSITVAIGFITGCLYHTYILVFYTAISRNDFYRVLMVTSSWLLYYLTKIFMLSYCCGAISQESIKTGDVISEFYDDRLIHESTKAEIRDFHIQLIQNPLKFGAYGFMTLDFTLIQGIIGSVTTYLVILIQLGNFSSPT